MQLLFHPLTLASTLSLLDHDLEFPVPFGSILGRLGLSDELGRIYRKWHVSIRISSIFILNLDDVDLQHLWVDVIGWY